MKGLTSSTCLVGSIPNCQNSDVISNLKCKLNITDVKNSIVHVYLTKEYWARRLSITKNRNLPQNFAVKRANRVFLYFLIFCQILAEFCQHWHSMVRDPLYVNAVRILPWFGRKLRNIGKVEWLCFCQKYLTEVRWKRYGHNVSWLLASLIGYIIYFLIFFLQL